MRRAVARRASEGVPGEYGELAQRSWSGCSGARMPGYLRDAALAFVTPPRCRPNTEEFANLLPEAAGGTASGGKPPNPAATISRIRPLSSYPLIRIAGTAGAIRRICPRAASPVRRGITRSRITRSISAPRRRKISTASSPSRASITSYPRVSSIARTTPRTSSSSSANSTRPAPAGWPSVAGGSAASGTTLTGRRTVHVVPFPSRETTRISPPWLSTIPRIAASPIPRPTPFVVKNGSKMRVIVFRIDPRPRVRHFENDASVPGLGIRANREPAAARHRLRGVQAKPHHDLLHLTGIHMDRLFQVRRIPTRARPREGGTSVPSGGSPTARAPAGSKRACTSPGGSMPGAAGSTPWRGSTFAGSRRGTGGHGGSHRCASKGARRRPDRGEDVVELVGDSAGKHPDRGERLALARRASIFFRREMSRVTRRTRRSPSGPSGNGSTTTPRPQTDRRRPASGTGEARPASPRRPCDGSPRDFPASSGWKNPEGEPFISSGRFHTPASGGRRTRVQDAPRRIVKGDDPGSAP